MEPRSINRWQHRLKREHPTCTERSKALIQECGWKGGDSGDSAGKKQRGQQIPKRIPLTPTGLLMEGDYTNYGSMSVVSMLSQLQSYSGSSEITQANLVKNSNAKTLSPKSASEVGIRLRRKKY
jgi:hypothetical protein